MVLQERIVLGKVTINHQVGGHCEIQKVKQIYDDISGDVKSENFIRSVVNPGDDAKAKQSGVDHITKGAWTKEIRDKAKQTK